MADCYQRPNPVFPALPEDLLIKAKPFFVRFFFVSLGKDPRPCYAHPVYLQSHPAQKTDIFPETVVKINRFRRRIMMPFIHLQHLPVPGNYRSSIRSRRADVHIGKPSSPFKNTSFTLVRRRSASPEKVLWKSSHFIHLRPSLF